VLSTGVFQHARLFTPTIGWLCRNWQIRVAIAV